MADAAAKRRLEFQADSQENHEKRGSDETMEFDNSAVVRLRRSEEVIAELKGKVQILSAESLRSNERWGNAVRENKLLMSRSLCAAAGAVLKLSGFIGLKRDAVRVN